MYHLILLCLCIISVEITSKLNFLVFIQSMLRVIKKIIFVLPNDNISDHWKEKVIPAYALRLMKVSLQVLIILLLVFSLFISTNYFYNGFLNFIISVIGIIESIFFTYGYFYLKRKFANE